MAGAPTGNKNAVKAKIWSDALRKHALQNDCVPKVAKKLFEMALDGDMAAIKEIGDRLEGKVTTMIGSDSDQPMTLQLITEFIEKKDTE